MEDQKPGFSEKNFTFIGTQANFEGILKVSGSTNISGKMSGEIHIEDQSLLTFETHSSFVGELYCHDLNVYGSLNGNVIASGKVTLFPTSKVKGKIKSENLVVYPGAQAEIQADAEEFTQRKS